MSDAKEKDSTIAYEPNCFFKSTVGDDFKLRDNVTEEQIRACETLLHNASDDFFAKSEPDLLKLELLINTISEPLSQHQLQSLQKHTYNIKSFAKVLGFPLITEICHHLVVTIIHSELSDRQKTALLKKLVEALRKCYVERIRGDGGVIGNAILSNLRSIVASSK